MEFCSSSASQGGSWPVHATGIRPTSLLIFISDRHLCQPVITANSSLTAVLECTGDGNLCIWAGDKPMEPPRHPSLKVRNKHHKKPMSQRTLPVLSLPDWAMVRDPGSSTWEQNSVSQETSCYWAPSCVPPVPRNATSHDRCTSKTAHKSKIYILLTLRS